MSLIFKLGTVSTYLTEFTFTKVNLQSCGPRAKGNAAAAAFPDASTLSGARALTVATNLYLLTAFTAAARCTPS